MRGGQLLLFTAMVTPQKVDCFGGGREGVSATSPYILMVKNPNVGLAVKIQNAEEHGNSVVAQPSVLVSKLQSLRHSVESNLSLNGAMCGQSSPPLDLTTSAFEIRPERDCLRSERGLHYASPQCPADMRRPHPPCPKSQPHLKFPLSRS